MVNLEEILEKKPYTCPVMVVKKINFADIIVTSPGDGKGDNGQGGGPFEGGDPDQYNEL